MSNDWFSTGFDGSRNSSFAPNEGSAAAAFFRVDGFLLAEFLSVPAFRYLCDLPPLFSFGARRLAGAASAFY